MVQHRPPADPEESGEREIGFRPVHYIGNKSRYLDVIERAIDDVAEPGKPACDLFAGTSVVTRRLAQRRPVLSADIQAYSQVLARALTRPKSFSVTEVDALLGVARERLETLRPSVDDLLAFEASALAAAGLDPTRLAAIIESGSLAAGDDGPSRLVEAKQTARRALSPETATLTWYYGGVYFSYTQALELDALLHAVRTIGGGSRDATAVASIMGAASDAVSTVGNHFAQPVRPRKRDGTLKHTWIGPVARRRRYSAVDLFANWITRYRELEPALHECTAVQSDFLDTLSGLDSSTGVIYADPPYTRDHYSRFYHVLETIALDDDPGVTWARDSSGPTRGLYRANRHQSPFSIRRQVRPAFEVLFAEAKRLGAPLVLSYSPMSEGTKARPETRLMSVDELVGTAAAYFTSISLIDVEASTHSRFNRVDLNAVTDGTAEILIVGRN